MRSQEQNEKFVKMIANNVGYHNKDVAVNHIVELLRHNKSFNPYEGFRNNGPDSFFSFVELIGFMQIGKILSKTYIGVARNYPQVPPIFLINYNRNVHQIFQYERLKAQNLISLEKNEEQEQYIKLKLPILTTEWNRSKTLLQVYAQVERIVSNPPLISIKKSAQKPNKQQLRWENHISEQRSLHRPRNSQLEGIQNKITKDILESKSNYDAILQFREDLEYLKNRNIFIVDYVPSLINQMEVKKAEIGKQIMLLNDAYSNSITQNSCEDYFEISEKDRVKLDLMSEQEALKESQKAVQRKIESFMDENNKFGEYKKIVKVLYDKMFENQSQLLKMAN